MAELTLYVQSEDAGDLAYVSFSNDKLAAFTAMAVYHGMCAVSKLNNLSVEICGNQSLK